MISNTEYQKNEYPWISLIRQSKYYVPTKAECPGYILPSSYQATRLTGIANISPFEYAY